MPRTKKHKLDSLERRVDAGAKIRGQIQYIKDMKIYGISFNGLEGEEAFCRLFLLSNPHFSYSLLKQEPSIQNPLQMNATDLIMSAFNRIPEIPEETNEKNMPSE